MSPDESIALEAEREGVPEALCGRKIVSRSIRRPWTAVMVLRVLSRLIHPNTVTEIYARFVRRSRTRWSRRANQKSAWTGAQERLSSRLTLGPLSKKVVRAPGVARLRIETRSCCENDYDTCRSFGFSRLLAPTRRLDGSARRQ